MRRHRITSTALAAAFAALLIFAPAAGAQRAVLGYLQLDQQDAPVPFGGTGASGQEGGAANNIAVVESGGASADAGDVYVAGARRTGGTSNPAVGGMVQQFSASGAFKRIWGTDVVASGPDNADEIQALRVDASAGTFTLSFKGDTTPALAAAATPQQVQDALNSLPSISSGGGSVSLSGGPGDAGGTAPYIVSFNGGPLAGADQPQLFAASGATPLSGGSATATVYTTNPGAAGVEVCQPANGDACKAPLDHKSANPVVQAFQTAAYRGAMGDDPTNLAIDQPSGDLYLLARGLNRVNRYSASGEFKRAFGFDVVRQGPDDSNVDDAQQLTVTAAAGTYTLTLDDRDTGCPDQTTVPLSRSAADPGSAPAAVKTAIDALPCLQSNGASVSVTGGPSGPGDPGPFLYTIVFGGNFAGDEVPELTATDGAALATLQDGGAPEVCDPDDLCKQGVGNGDGDGSIGKFASSLAVAPASAPNAGDLLIGDPSNVSEFTAAGKFVRTFGWDVVKSGPDQQAGAPDERQQLTVKASGGTFRLGLDRFGLTPPLAFNAPASGPGSVEAALNALPTIGGLDPPGSVTVTGGPGDAGGNSPYTVTFGGSLAAEGVHEIVSDYFSLVGLQTITPQDAAAGTFTLEFPVGQGKTTTAIPFNASAASVQTALAALSTIGAGNVSVSGPAGGPWQVTFTGALAANTKFLSADASALSGGPDAPTVTVAGPSAAVTTLTQGGAFEVCKAATADVCKRGSDGPGLGQFDGTSGFGSAGSIAEGDDGTIYTVESGSAGSTAGNPGNRRVQKFTPAGGLDLTPSAVGADETQALTVNAAAGQFRLIAIDPGRSFGRASATYGSPVLTNVTTQTGAFRVGQRIEIESTRSVLPPGTTILAVGPGTITMSAPMDAHQAVCSGGATTCKVSLASDRLYTTPDLSASASPADMQAAIDALPPIGDDGSSVTVTGGPGDSGANHPYTITYDGGPAAGTDFAPLGVAAGTTPLSGGTGPGADQAIITTLGDGGPSGRSRASRSASESTDILPISPPVGVGVGPGGEISVAKQFPDLAAPCAAGLPFDSSFAETRIQQLSPDGLSLSSTSPPCAFDPKADFTALTQETGIAPSLAGAQDRLRVDPSTGEDYLLVVAALGQGNPHPRVYIYGEAGTDPQLSVDPVSGAGATGATITGSIDPNGTGPIDHPNPSLTRYAVQFRKVGDTDWTTYVSAVPVGSGSSPVPFNVGISGLLPKTTYEARVVVTKPWGFAQPIHTTAPFTTSAGRPKVESPYSDNLSAHAADLHGLVNPSGDDTTYRFEYGPTIAYGQSTPPVDVGNGATPVTVQAHLEDLDPLVYHFRILATNSVGTTTGGDQTFNFYPEPCPNAAARQQTGSSLLPDCRAYELVSPPGAGSTILLPYGPSAALASNPPRFAYAVGGGILPGGDWNPPNVGGGDTYVATRIDNGWRTRFVGIGAEHGGGAGNPGTQGINLPADDGLDRFLQWGLNPAQTGTSSAPTLFDAEGDQLGRLPTNLAEIPAADLPPFQGGGFYGNERLSGDGRHFVYSSAALALAPGGLASGAGSVYDNEIATGTVSVVSKTESGGDIPQAPGAANTGRALQLPGVSTDGSHVLIGAPAACDGSGLLFLSSACPASPAILYMRVNDTTSYDVSGGHPVKFEGMSRDGSAVYFTTDEQLTSDDHDTSTDLYMWSEAGDRLTRVSAGADPVGDTDACAASWISGCGVQVANPTAFEGRDDSAVAASANAAYFYSPEQFVGTEGFPGRRNLYAYRDGALHFVAALDADKPATRIGVSADGRYAAFLTKSRLTAYDNAGHAEMYRYDDAGGELVCASCDPTGAPPSHDVQASSNGIFMSDDGRAFFATSDPLIPRDADGLLDVYEFVDGRAQLISTGVAAQTAPNTGLVGVSADGADAYFATLETLVPQDDNGPFLKFYDARVGGGFPLAAQIQPCAAADECRGARNPTPVAPSLSGTADLGNSGNASPPKPCRKGTVRKHGRCVAHHRHKSRHHPRTGHGGKR